MSMVMVSVGVIIDDCTGNDGGTTRQQQHPTTPTIIFFLVHFMDAVMVSDTSCWELIVEYCATVVTIVALVMMVLLPSPMRRHLAVIEERRGLQ